MQHGVLHYDDSLEDNQVRQTHSDANPVNLSFCRWPLTDTFSPALSPAVWTEELTPRENGEKFALLT